jgi:hypothetical protein
MTAIHFPIDLNLSMLAEALRPLGLRLRYSVSGAIEAEYRKEPDVIDYDPYIASPHFNANGYWADSFARKGEVAWCVFKGTQLLARVETREQAERVIDLAMGVHPWES